VDFAEFRRALESAEKAAGSGDDASAARILVELAGSSLPSLDRALAWTQAAAAYERLGRDSDALKALDAAVALEKELRRFTAAFKKADYLLRLGRKEESRLLFASLAELPEATLAERASVASRLKLLRRVSEKK
jgi:tetratricopeptide (TPR) repeat protein